MFLLAEAREAMYDGLAMRKDGLEGICLDRIRPGLLKEKKNGPIRHCVF
jgi:hypothetical protein